MNRTTEIVLYNRQTGGFETETIYGRKWMTFFYGRPVGRRIAARVLCHKPISKLYALLQRHGLSRRTIAPFARQYRIDLREAIVPEGGFRSFHDFFVRRLHSWARPVESNPSCFVSPADSRLQAFRIQDNYTIRVKGIRMTLAGLLGFAGMDPAYKGGWCLSFRLAPSDYHRFGFVDTGIQGRVHCVGGLLHSVSPLALRHKGDILATNFRQWCLLQTKRWGTLLQVEVGAMMVGSIKQHKPGGGPCLRGEEKGFFQFGGSTVLVLVKPGRLVIDSDILRHSDKGIETLVRYGESVGRAARD